MSPSAIVENAQIGFNGGGALVVDANTLRSICKASFKSCSASRIFRARQYVAQGRQRDRVVGMVAADGAGKYPALALIVVGQR